GLRPRPSITPGADDRHISVTRASWQAETAGEAVEAIGSAWLSRRDPAWRCPSAVVGLGQELDATYIPAAFLTNRSSKVRERSTLASLSSGSKATSMSAADCMPAAGIRPDSEYTGWLALTAATYNALSPR